MGPDNLMTKIICTIGPASANPRILAQLIQGGMNVARLNFSHGDVGGHRQTFENIRKLARDLGRTVGILQDLPGPKLRVGELFSPTVQLVPGEEFILTGRKIIGDAHLASVNYPALPQHLKPGNIVLLRDGMLKLEVLEITGQDIHCRVIDGGHLSSHQGINLPGAALNIPAITSADREYLKLGLEWGVDFVAMSFVKTAEEVLALKSHIASAGYNTPVIAKLEKPEAIAHLESIIRAADGVMIARGDLGIEMSVAQLPMLQKKIISLANQLGKSVITATQMLESMIRSPRPTRAEASDVANSVLDGTDAVMLSGETAMGQYPVEALSTMVDIICATEQAQHDVGGLVPGVPIFGGRLHSESQAADAVCYGAYHAAVQVQARCIVVFTQSGYTARLVSKYRPAMPIIAFTPNPQVQVRMSLCWGIKPLLMANVNTLEELIDRASGTLMEQKLADRGDRVVFILGLPLSMPGVTNLIKVHEVA